MSASESKFPGCSHLYLIRISYVIVNSSPVHDWALHERARKTADDFIDRLKEHLVRLSGSIVSSATSF